MKARDLGGMLWFIAIAITIHHYWLHGYALDIPDLLTHEFFLGLFISAGAMLVFYHKIARWVR